MNLYFVADDDHGFLGKARTQGVGGDADECRCVVAESHLPDDRQDQVLVLRQSQARARHCRQYPQVSHLWGHLPTSARRSGCPGRGGEREMQSMNNLGLAINSKCLLSWKWQGISPDLDNAGDFV